VFKLEDLEELLGFQGVEGEEDLLRIYTYSEITRVQT
jgi:hypothetical protein